MSEVNGSRDNQNIYSLCLLKVPLVGTPCLHIGLPWRRNSECKNYNDNDVKNNNNNNNNKIIIII